MFYFILFLLHNISILLDSLSAIVFLFVWQKIVSIYPRCASQRESTAIYREIKCLSVIFRRIHRSQQGLRRSPGSSESGKQVFNSPSSSSSSSSSEGRQGRSSTPNPFRRANIPRQHQSARTNQVSPESHQSRVRRSRSLQLPEKRSPGATGGQRDHSNEAHRVVVKIVNDRGGERSKRHVLQNREYQLLDIPCADSRRSACVYQIFYEYKSIDAVVYRYPQVYLV